MDDKYMSKLSPTVDFWAGMYLMIIGKYIVYLFHLYIMLTVVERSLKINVLSLHRFILLILKK